MATMREDRGELDLTKQLEEKDELIQELRMRIRDMLIFFYVVRLSLAYL